MILKFRPREAILVEVCRYRVDTTQRRHEEGDTFILIASLCKTMADIEYTERLLRILFLRHMLPFVLRLPSYLHSSHPPSVAYSGDWCLANVLVASGKSQNRKGASHCRFGRVGFLKMETGIDSVCDCDLALAYFQASQPVFIVDDAKYQEHTFGSSPSFVITGNPVTEHHFPLRPALAPNPQCNKLTGPATLPPILSQTARQFKMNARRSPRPR